jgi:protein disulfide-isomerase A1
LLRQLLPAFTVLEAGKVEAFAKSEKVVVVGYFAAEAKDARKAFESVAAALRDDFVFGVTSDADALKKAKVEKEGIVLYKKFDEGKAVFKGEFTKDAITSFVQAKSVPLMVYSSIDLLG